MKESRRRITRSFIVFSDNARWSRVGDGNQPRPHSDEVFINF